MRLTTALPRTVLLGVSLLCADAASAQVPDPQTSVLNLKKLSIEQLMDVEVTSASKIEEPLGATATAVAVVTSEDIRRSGAASVPEALRLVPGLHVARQTSSIWAISARGFSSTNSEKLLVLSDTRSLYTPLFSGVFWDAQDYLLQDIDRIEVIRGPGATLWGANAVNGVINITTKSARDTQGLYVTANAGSTDRASVGARYGGRLPGGAYYRVFAKYSGVDGTHHPGIPGQDDDWQMGHAGGRADWELDGSDTFTLQGDVYTGEIGQLNPSLAITGRPFRFGLLRADIAGGNILGRWRRRMSDGSDLQVRAYYERTHRDDPTYENGEHTFDIDVQQRMLVTPAHELTWGGTYHVTADETLGKGVASMEPPESTDSIVSGFVQGQVQVPHAVRLTGGTKLEYNEFSGVEVQPSGRAAWDITPEQMLWGAVSRAVRVPTRFERDFQADASPPGADPAYRLTGSPEFGVERLIAYEAGYRWKPRTNLSIDVTAFENRYRGLASLEFGDPFVDPNDGRTVVPLLYENSTRGNARGIEALATFTPARWWRVVATSSSLHLDLQPLGDDLNAGALIEGRTPRHQFGLRSYLDLPRAFQFDALFRHLTALRDMPGEPQNELPGYAELDVRLAWRGWQQMEISLVGQSLLHEHHAEFGSANTRGEIPRGMYVRLAWGF